MDVVVQGTGATVEVNFAQLEPEVISQVVPEGTLTASGTFEVGATAGTSLLGLAKQLVLSGTNGVTSQQLTVRDPGQSCLRRRRRVAVDCVDGDCVVMASRCPAALRPKF